MKSAVAAKPARCDRSTNVATARTTWAKNGMIERTAVIAAQTWGDGRPATT